MDGKTAGGDVLMPRYEVNVAGRNFTVRIEDDGRCTVDSVPAEVVATGPHQYRASIGDRIVALAAVGNGTGIDVSIGGNVVHATAESERDRLLRTLARSASRGPLRSEVRAPMPALIVRMEVASGTVVHTGQGLLVLEAMKMENEIRASHEGTVTDVRVKQGQVVEKDQLLLVVEEAGPEKRIERKQE
jgi:pyruvate carboxylase subunit B